MSKRKKRSARITAQARSGSSLPLALNLHMLTGIVIIFLAAFFLYFPSLNGGFVLDDDKLLTDNRMIKAADGLYRFWFTTEAIDYWPLSNTTLWIEWRLWGMNPTGYHVTNLILHIVNALLIWLVLWKLSIPGAFWAALIFAVHPVNVESVAWISQRKGLLAMVFFLLSILCYLKFEVPWFSAQRPLSQPADAGRSPTVYCYCLSLLAFILAVLSKGSVVVLPVILLGIIWWRRKVTGWDILRMVPFFFLSIVGIVVNVWFQKHGQEIVTREADFLQRLLGAGGVLWFYIYKAFLPIDLAFIYPLWQIKVGNMLCWLPLAAAMFVTTLLWWYRQGWSRPFLFAWGFFCVSLIPVLGFTDVGFMKYSLVSDHYQYMAIMGVIGLAAAGYATWHQRTRASARSTVGAVAIMVLGVLSFLTWRQSGLYSNAITLYQATLEKNPACWIAHNNLGNVLDETGRDSEAMEHYREALRLNPNYADAHNNLGVSLNKMGRLPEAVEHYHEALHNNPNYAEAHNNLGYALIQMNQLPEAHEHLLQALRLNPNYADAHNNLGLYVSKIGRPQEAMEHYRQALNCKFNFPEAHNNLGNALVQTSRLPEAIESYQQALKFMPNYAEACNNLGVALLRAGRPQEAIAAIIRALEIDANYLNAYLNLVLVYSKTNQTAKAVAAAQKALELARSQNQREAIEQLEEWLNKHRLENQVK